MENFKGPVGYQFDEGYKIKDILDKFFKFIERHPVFFNSFALILLAYSFVKMWMILR